MSEPTVLADRKPATRGTLVARWALPLAAAVAAIPLTKLAYDTSFDLREQDSCAGGWDNIWSTASSVALWAALISAVVFVVFAVRAKRTVEATLGGVAIALILTLSVVCWIYANGGYGWHC